MLAKRREAELDYYRDLYANHGYGQGPSMRHAITDKVCRDYGNNPLWTKWLDVGAGTRIVHTPSCIKVLRRTDPGRLQVMDNFAIHELVNAYGVNSFDVVSCFDVLEHLLPEELDEALMCLWAVCKPGGRLIVSVGTDRGADLNGRDTHLIQKPMVWWKWRLGESWHEITVDHVATSKGTSPFFVADKPKRDTK